LLELESYFSARSVRFKVLKENDLAIVVDLPSLNFKKIIKELGGIQKIAQVIDKVDGLYEGKENKVKYAISMYSDEDVSELKDDLKRYFKSEGLKAMIKKSHHQQDYLTPSEAKNVLELVVFDKYVAKTIALFDPNDHKTRDLKRPVQRPLHTISIRLAKILINLSGAKKGDRLLDPFCGIGTILGEALLKDIHVIGMDSNRKCVDSSKKNLIWLGKTFHVKYEYKLLLGDATRLSSKVKKIKYIVTEPYMGPFLKKLPTELEARKTIKQLEPMYNELLNEFKKARCKRAVIVIPEFLCRSKRTLELRLDLKEFKVSSIDYETPTSIIRRKILILEPKAL